MDITLIRPPAYSTGLMGVQLGPHLGLAYLAASAREAGHSVDIVDMCGEDIEHTEILSDKYIAYGMPLKSLKCRIKKTQLIGFTCMFSQDWPFHRKLIKYVHSLYPESLLVAGGEHITALPDFSLEDCPELDVCVVGEADKAFVDLIHALGTDRDLSKISSLVYRKNGIKHTPRAGRIRNIDELPYPAWDLFPIESYLSRNLNYHVKRGRTIPMLATRGCPHKCTFCSNSNMWSAPWIPRKPKSIVEEMQFYIKRYKAENFIFSDLSAVIGKEHITELCEEIIKSNIKVTFQLTTLRTEALDYGLLKLIYRAGCRELDFAIESGSNTVLMSINKNNNPKRMSVLVSQALDVGFNVCSNIIVGLPKENLLSYMKSFFLVMKLSVKGMQELNVFPFIPYPGSRLFYEYRERGEIKLGDKFFFVLFSFADISKAVSFSKNFNRKTLYFLRLMLLSSFYGLMFLTHPYRIFRLFSDIFQGKTSTKLENILSRILRGIRISLNKRMYSNEEVVN